jgi:RimJ/RimL family protein N-acetyltransferase
VVGVVQNWSYNCAVNHRAGLPHLETERLQLRWLTEDDADLMLAIWNDPDFVRFVGDRGVRTLDEARDALRNGILQLYRDFGFGPYRLALSGSDEAMGICGLFKRDNLEYPDIGYGLLPAYCGSGYAFEAAQAVAEHAREHMKVAMLYAIVSAENTRSVHLLEKLGMVAGGPIRMPGEDADVILFSVDYGSSDI